MSQSFASAEALGGDLSKAVSLALRLNCAYGLKIAARPERYKAEVRACCCVSNR